MTAPSGTHPQQQMVPFMGAPSECFLDPTVLPVEGSAFPPLPGEAPEVHACEASPNGDEVRVVVR